jgi:glyoxylase-like metal-dependent hydrolase (beta-lactamase superfamily II)
VVLTQVAEGVLIHQSEFYRTNTVVVQGDAGVLLVDPGLHEHEFTCLIGDLAELGAPVVAAFATHPHWDHVLWHPGLADVPRHATPAAAAAAEHARTRLADPEEKPKILAMIPPEIAADIHWDLFARLTPLPGAELPWPGPTVRIIEHQAHAPGHAALLIEDRGVLIAGDMLSDVLPPLPSRASDTPEQDYLAALDRFEALADRVDVLIPGHGTTATRPEMRTRIASDRTQVTPQA